MALNSAFIPQGATVVVTTNGVTLTASSQQILLSGPTVAGSVFQPLGAGNQPASVRIFNSAAGVVFVSLTPATRVAVAPIQGTNSLELPIGPGLERVFSGLTWAPGNPPSLWVNTIAVGISAVLYCTFGEGR